MLGTFPVLYSRDNDQCFINYLIIEIFSFQRDITQDIYLKLIRLIVLRYLEDFVVLFCLDTSPHLNNLCCRRNEVLKYVVFCHFHKIQHGRHEVVAAGIKSRCMFQLVLLPLLSFS